MPKPLAGFYQRPCLDRTPPLCYYSLPIMQNCYTEHVNTLMADQSLDLYSVGASLATLFSDLNPVMPLHVLGSGFSNLVVETAGNIVFRIARNRRAASQHAKEARLLPQLKSHLPLPIPEPQWYAA